MSDFHLLRPEWLLALIPLLALIIYRKRKQALSGQWKNIIAPQLQPYVLKQQETKPQEHWIQAALWLSAFIGILAMSGPSWQKQPSLVYNNQAGLVIALDLSLSMTSQDLTPSRLQRAKYKITDILKQQKNKNMALIAYAGDAHTASPLTRDIKTIQSMLPALDPYIMPAQGSNLVHLVEQATALFEQGKSKPRQLLLVTDGVEPQDISAASEALKKADIQLSILAIGTEQGAPIVKPNGQFFKDGQGNVIMPGLEWENLQTLANTTQSRITKIANDDRDINYLIKDNPLKASFEQQKESIEFDQWQDGGYWLILPMLLLSLLAFRKGVIIIALLAIVTQPQESWADDDIPDFLLNNNQIGQKQFDQNPEAAAKTFIDPQWRASSLYKAGDYQGALDIWQASQDAQSLYNQGNALAHLQRTDEAIAAYDKALKISPNLEDAIANKALLEQLKEQQEQQSEDEQQGDEQNNEQGDSQDKKSKDGEKGDSKDQQEGQKSDSQQDGEQNQESEGTSDEQGDESKNPLSEQQTKEEALKEKEAQKARQEQNEGEQSPGDDKLAGTETQTKSTEQLEKEQAMKQWIERIPDDPGGLLRNKFIYQYNKRNRNEQNGDRKPW
ncbi:MAG: VWA domain-containing protein [Bermanella sp.]